MYLNNIAMIAADTTRSKLYLLELIKKEMRPSYVILLLNKNNDLLPGQQYIKNKNELIELLVENNISFDIAPNCNINSHELVSLISIREEEVFIFSGFGGELLREDMLNSGKKFLHIHGGYLPDYKGSTTNYYSLLTENIIAASSMFLSNEIDSGSVLLRRKFSAPKDRTQIDHIYDSEVRSKVLIETLSKYIKSGIWDFDLKNNEGGEIYYIIHPVLKHLAILGE